jgi:hypothetical protein
MTKILSLLASGAMLAVLAAPADAAIYNTTFSGTVTATQGTTYATGNAVTGSFTYDSGTNTFLNFTIGNQSAVQPFTSSVSVAPGGVIGPYSAFFTAQYSPVQQTGSQNETFTLDLEALDKFSQSTALGILTDPTLASQLDPTLSQFTFYLADANGTNIRSLTASLSTVNTANTAVPEPASLLLLAAPMLGFAVARRR